MFNWLKKYFIPHEANDHRPQILGWRALGVFLFIIVGVEAFYLVPTLVLYRNDLGTAGIVTITKSTTTLASCVGSKEAIEARINEIRAQKELGLKLPAKKEAKGKDKKGKK
jgi:hypothetical protein